jgi:hypothetical protein
MPFSGKATYSAGETLPEIADDVADLVAINSPHETPLLDALGDAPRSAKSTRHEWLEDALVPNVDTVSSFEADPDRIVPTNPERFRVGDQVKVSGTGEIVLITAIDPETDEMSVVRGYGGSTEGSIDADDELVNLGNASLEGADAHSPRFTTRSRKSNFTQIFATTVEVSGTELAVRKIAVRDEMEYQKNQRLRELLRDLENTVINGVAPTTTTQGSATVRRTMNGIASFVQSNRFAPGENAFPSETTLTEEQLNVALREIWQNSSGGVDLILVNGREKRAINGFIASNRRFISDSETMKSMVNIYESDFGVCRVVMSRWVPAGTVYLLDSSRIAVMPLTSRSFHYKPLARTGDRETGQLIGEYTLELRNENAHGVITGLS